MPCSFIACQRRHTAATHDSIDTTTLGELFVLAAGLEVARFHVRLHEVLFAPNASRRLDHYGYDRELTHRRFIEAVQIESHMCLIQLLSSLPQFSVTLHLPVHPVILGRRERRDTKVIQAPTTPICHLRVPKDRTAPLLHPSFRRARKAAWYKQRRRFTW